MPPSISTRWSLTILMTIWPGVTERMTSAPIALRPDLVDELADDGQGDVGLEQGRAHLAQGRVDIGLGKRTAPPQLVEYVAQTLAQTLEHRAPVRSKTYRADARTFADQRSSPKGEPSKSARPIERAGYKACRVRSQNAWTACLTP